MGTGYWVHLFHLRAVFRHRHKHCPDILLNRNVECKYHCEDAMSVKRSCRHFLPCTAQLWTFYWWRLICAAILVGLDEKQTKNSGLMRVQYKALQHPPIHLWGLCQLICSAPSQPDNLQSSISSDPVSLYSTLFASHLPFWDPQGMSLLHPRCYLCQVTGCCTRSNICQCLFSWMSWVKAMLYKIYVETGKLYY